MQISTSWKYLDERNKIDKNNPEKELFLSIIKDISKLLNSYWFDDNFYFNLVDKKDWITWIQRFDVMYLNFQYNKLHNVFKYVDIEKKMKEFNNTWNKPNHILLPKWNKYKYHTFIKEWIDLYYKIFNEINQIVIKHNNVKDNIILHIIWENYNVGISIWKYPENAVQEWKTDNSQITIKQMLEKKPYFHNFNI